MCEYIIDERGVCACVIHTPNHHRDRERWSFSPRAAHTLRAGKKPVAAPDRLSKKYAPSEWRVGRRLFELFPLCGDVLFIKRREKKKQKERKGGLSHERKTKKNHKHIFNIG